MTPFHQPITLELIGLLLGRPDLAANLEQAISTAALPGLGSLEEFYDYLDRMVTSAPQDTRAFGQFDLQYYYVLDCSPGGLLKKDPAFQRWNTDLARAWAAFLDSEASLAHLDRFLADPGYQLDQYQRGPSGWRTFNQFFGREVKPGMRPVGGPCDPSVIVSPADCTLWARERISEQSTITSKGVTFAIKDLLADSPHWDAFRGGWFMHSLLQTYDYHRYHAPIAGEVLESRQIPGHVTIDVTKEDGRLVPHLGTGFQFTQARGLFVIGGSFGPVAVIPVGMAWISSCVLTAEPGRWLAKGEEFGYFQFGGSDIVVLLPAPVTATHFAVDIGEHRKQGERIASRVIYS